MLQRAQVLTATVESGKLDGGAALLLNNHKLKFIAGGFVADHAQVAAVETHAILVHAHELDEGGLGQLEQRLVDVKAAGTTVLMVTGQASAGRRAFGRANDTSTSPSPPASGSMRA